MMHVYRKIALLAILVISTATIAQAQHTISGTVINMQSKEKVVLVAIQILELNRWTTSGMQGEFSFLNVPVGKYTLQACCLGYEKYDMPLIVNASQTNLSIQLLESTLGLEEVVVVARENTNLSSSSKIENTAIEHVQPTNLADVMQLVPGQVTLNPDMSGSNQITIRDINNENNPNDNDALGTAIIIDGTPVDNDANMQTLNTAGSGTSQGYSTAGQGVDLRRIATDNIESVEVIRGIPSVEYGELTTGAVLVKTKAGKTPLNAKVKADPRIKQLAFSKGFLVPGTNNGAINLDMDYTHSFDDLRKPSKTFSRITSQMGYSNTLFSNKNPLSINFKINFFNTFDNNKSDPDQLKEELFQEKEKGIDVKLYGKWSVNKKWLNNIHYNMSASQQDQSYYEYKLTANNNAAPLPLAYESGESEGALLPSQYYSELTIDGKPYNYFGTLKMETKWKAGITNNQLKYGVDWRSSGNNGGGRIYDQLKPPSGALSTRPRAFKDVPVSHKLALFIEDELCMPIKSTSLTLQAGLRYNNLLPKGLFNTKGFITLEPRINSIYDIIKYDKTRILHNLSFRFGYGMTSKTPSMLHLYPDKSYEDELSFNYYPDLIVVTTQVIDDTSNPDLKPMTNEKFEAGVNLNIKKVKFMLTAFKETIENGFSWDSQYFGMDYRKWEQLEGAGKSPFFENGNVYYIENGQVETLPYDFFRDFHSYRMPKNNYRVNKKGLEYVVDLGQIRAIRTSFRADGAYYHINRIDDAAPFTEKKNISYLGGKFPFVTVFPGGKGSTNQRFNSNIKTITHIPELKMVFSLSTQIIWLNTHQYYWKDNNQKPLAYSLGSNNEKRYGHYEGVDKIYLDPVGYYDIDMVYHEWQDHYSFESPYAFMVKIMDSDHFMKDSYPILWQMNLKLTKEFSKNAKLSFFANNLFNHMPLQKSIKTGYYSRKNQPVYFGAELKLSL
jgi:outer membrane receptor protein involved in Fe transport